MSNADAYQAVRIARSLLDGSTPLFLGCIQLEGPLDRLGVREQPEFSAIIGVNSETDDCPLLPDVRKMWDPEALAKKDAELAVYLPRIQDAVFEVCRAVIDRFGAAAYPPGNWTVYRIDDNGNEFVVESHIDEDAANRIVTEFEARGHKQTYWAQRDAGS
jgi:hypothetical protein